MIYNVQSCCRDLIRAFPGSKISWCTNRLFLGPTYVGPKFALPPSHSYGCVSWGSYQTEPVVSLESMFFIPVKVLSKKFRGKYLYYLKQYYERNQLEFYNDTKQYKNPKQFKRLLDECYSLNWYSYSKRTFSGPLAVVQYLGRYTHRIAISNNRIVSVNQDTVTIRVKDYRNKSQKTTITMKAVEFIRRFLMHISPEGISENQTLWPTSQSK